MNALSPAASLFYDSINGAASPDQLDNLGRAVWHHWGKGEFTDDEATFLNSAIDNRRPLGRRASSAPGAVTAKPVGRLHARLGSRFTPRQRPRSPDRQASRDRRRRLGGSSALPDTLRHHYTEGQRAVLCIIAGEIKHHGVCDLPIDKIAALAGVCRTTVQTTLHEARRLAHIRITEAPAEPDRDRVCGVADMAQARAVSAPPYRVQSGDFSEHHEEHIQKERGIRGRKVPRIIFETPRHEAMGATICEQVILTDALR